MTFEIELDGVTRTVSVERVDRGRYRIVLDENSREPVLVDAAKAGEYVLSLLVDASGVSREVVVAPSNVRGELVVAIDGRSVRLNVNGRRSRRRSGEAAGAGGGESSIAAPMPGRIVRVLVGPGDAVAARQPLVVVEAMKMENELRSPRAGTVKDVTVTPGMSVEAGRVLVTVA